MKKAGDRFSFFLTLFLSLLFLSYGIFTLKKNELSLSDIFSADPNTMTITFGDNRYTMDPAVREALFIAADGADNAASYFLPAPVKKTSEDFFVGIFRSLSVAVSGIDSAVSLLVRGNM